VQERGRAGRPITRGGRDDAREQRTGTIYPALNRLERLGLVRSIWLADSARRRRCYEITDAGRRSLADERSAWRTFTATIGAIVDPDPSPGTP
jgi:PadR family transcriptional regulator PadR